MAAASSTAHTKINLDRLLRSCDALGDSLADKAARRRFVTYLTVLQRYWHDLDAAGESEVVLGEYRRRIERLAELVDEGKMLSGVGSALALSQAHNNAGLTRAQANAELASRHGATTRVQESARTLLLQPSGGGADGGGGRRIRGALPGAAAEGGGGGGGGGGGVEEEALSATLEEQEAMQESLLADMSHSVAELRARTIQARAAVRDDMSTLDVAGDTMSANQNKTEKLNEKLSAASKRMSSSTCLVWMMMLVVCGLFVFMYLLMKTFSKRKPRPA
jgi:uncharacterized coiled-coil protein SlyX